MRGNGSLMMRWGLVLGLMGWLLVGLLGCCGHHTEQDYGRSVTHNLAVQVVNPDAGRVAQVGAGLSPQAAVNAYDKYNQSFKPGERQPLLKLTTQD